MMKKGTFTYKEDSYNFNFKTSLSAFEKLSFVRNVVDTIVTDRNYDVVIRDLIFDFNILELFTNVDTSFINMKDEEGNDINKIVLIEHFLDESNVVDIVKANMEVGLLKELIDAIDLNIQYLTGISPKPINDAFANLLSTLDKKIENIDLNGMMNMAQKFVNMTDDFTVENIVNAYIDSDVHQNNLSEIKESKETKTEAKKESKKVAKEK